MTLDWATTLTLLGIIGSIIGCTWYLGVRAGGIIASNRGLRTSVDDLAATFNGHVTKSETRDQDNRDAHTMLRLADAATVETLKGVNHRLERVDRDSEETKRLAIALDKRVTLCEDRVETLCERLDVLEARVKA